MIYILTFHHSDPKENAESPMETLPLLKRKASPDGSWGWLVVFAGFTLNFLNNGSILALGIFFETFVTRFATSHQSIAMANSIQHGISWCGMPINSALVNLFGFRNMCFLGGIIYGLGYFITTSFDDLYIFYFA